MSGARGRVGTRAVLLGIFVVSLLLAGVVSFYAAATPDGLTKVSEDQGFATSETDHATGDGPFAGYSAGFLDGDRLSGGVAGVVGVLVVLALGTGLTLLVGRRGPRTAPDRDTADRDDLAPHDAEA